VRSLRHSDKAIEQAAERFERLAEQLDPATATVEQIEDLRAVAAAAEAARADEARLREVVSGGARARSVLESDCGRARRLPAGRAPTLCPQAARLSRDRAAALTPSRRCAPTTNTDSIL